MQVADEKARENTKVIEEQTTRIQAYSDCLLQALKDKNDYKNRNPEATDIEQFAMEKRDECDTQYPEFAPNN